MAMDGGSGDEDPDIIVVLPASSFLVDLWSGPDSLNAIAYIKEENKD